MPCYTWMLYPIQQQKWCDLFHWGVQLVCFLVCFFVWLIDCCLVYFCFLFVSFFVFLFFCLFFVFLFVCFLVWLVGCCLVCFLFLFVSLFVFLFFYLFFCFFVSFLFILNVFSLSSVFQYKLYMYTGSLQPVTVYGTTLWSA